MEEAQMNLRLSVESKKVLTEMGSVCTHGRTRIDLNSGEQEELQKQKTYWVMPYIFEETNDDCKFIVHELPESISKQILDFINQ